MAQSLAKLWIHLILSTKGRYPFLVDPVSGRHAWLLGKGAQKRFANSFRVRTNLWFVTQGVALG